jgi:hypothetical protein
MHHRAAPVRNWPTWGDVVFFAELKASVEKRLRHKVIGQVRNRVETLFRTVASRPFVYAVMITGPSLSVWRYERGQLDVPVPAATDWLAFDVAAHSPGLQALVGLLKMSLALHGVGDSSLPVSIPAEFSPVQLLLHERAGQRLSLVYLLQGNSILKVALAPFILSEERILRSLEQCDVVGCPRVIRSAYLEDRGYLELQPACHALERGLGPSTVLRVLSDVAQVLAQAAAAEFVHCDVSLANIGVCDGRGYLLDWGLSRTLAEAQSNRGAVTGTPLFMAFAVHSGMSHSLKVRRLPACIFQDLTTSAD